MVPLGLPSVFTLVPVTFFLHSQLYCALAQWVSDGQVPYLARPLSNIATAEHLTPHLRLLQGIQRKGLIVHVLAVVSVLYAALGLNGRVS